MLFSRNLKIFSFGFAFFLSVAVSFAWAQNGYIKSTTGAVDFTSNAPLESIKATSTGLQGVINPANFTFAFSVPIASFQGFNSALQRQHFNDNYLESAKYKYGVFKGKFIEEINFKADGVHQIRAKGELEIHGVKVQRIIRGTITIKGGQIAVAADFDVPLAEHNIEIPKIVYQKIAEVIKVKVKLAFPKP